MALIGRFQKLDGDKARIYADLSTGAELVIKGTETPDALQPLLVLVAKLMNTISADIRTVISEMVESQMVDASACCNELQILEAKKWRLTIQRVTLQLESMGIRDMTQDENDIQEQLNDIEDCMAEKRLELKQMQYEAQVEMET